MTSLASLMAPNGVVTPNKAQILTNKDLSSSTNTLMTLVIVSATTKTCVAGSHYILTNVAATTATLPASPTAGDTVWITTVNGLKTNIIARNGSTIMGVAEDLTNDVGNITFQFRYVNSSWRMM